MSHQAARDILKGFAHRNEAALEQLASFTDWRRVAGQELERRATAIVQALDDDTLKAIAAGDIDFQKLCRDVLAEVQPKAA
jgi:hypothetical protein